MQQPAPPLVLPRGLILLASAWLVASWLLAIGLRTPIEASSASYTPGVRLMLICLAIGLVIGWPLLRVSQPPMPFPVRQVLLDLVVLLALVQVVIWPLRLVTPWSPARTAALDATLVAWALLAGAFVAAVAGSPRAGPRNLAMLGCAGMCVIGPVLALACLGVPTLERVGQKLARIGPLLEVHFLSAGGGSPPAGEQWVWIGLVGLAAVACWIGLGLAAAARRRE
ncbi:MAG: hypothetical protein ACYTE6_13375 [Planctomycetota bacterium]|jgi:hypothetical protein